MRQAPVQGLQGWGTVAGCCALALACYLRVEPAVAAERAAGQSADSSASLYSEADAAMQAGNFPRVKELLQRAWEQSPTFDIAGSLADVELRLKDYVNAAEHARFALNHLPATDGEKYRVSIQRVLDQAVKELGLLRISAEPAGAELLLDGLPTSRSPFVLPGRHTITARLDGYEEETQSVKLAALERMEVTFTLRQKARPPKSAPDEITYGQRVEPSGGTPARSGGPILALGGSLATLTGAIGAGLLAGTKPAIERNRAGTYALMGSVGLSLATSVTWQIWSGVTAPSDSGRNYLERTFVAGNSRGEPGVGKLVTVVALHVATAATLGLGVWKYIDTKSGALDAESEAAQQACRGSQAASSEACSQWQERAQVADDDRKLTVGLLAGAGLLHLLGMTVAEWWPNVTPVLATSRGGVTVRGAF